LDAFVGRPTIIKSLAELAEVQQHYHTHTLSTTAANRNKQLSLQIDALSNKTKEIATYLLNQVQNILVVDKFYVTPVNLLPVVLFLLHFKNILR